MFDSSGQKHGEMIRFDDNMFFVQWVATKMATNYSLAFLVVFRSNFRIFGKHIQSSPFTREHGLLVPFGLKPPGEAQSFDSLLSGVSGTQRLIDVIGAGVNLGFRSTKPTDTCFSTI